MAGIYIHIPFCKQKCSYCNFHFSTQLEGKEDMHKALLQELDIRQEEMSNQPIDTIYLGGGTPSLWSPKELIELFLKIESVIGSQDIQEITIECNPDDLTMDYLEDLKKYTPANRLSVGVQSFHEEDLRLMNRSHNASEARIALDNIFQAGYQEISADLIFGLPHSNTDKWWDNLTTITQYPVHHISCYNLTIEDKTAFKYQLQQGKLSLPDDEETIEQFYMAKDFLQDKGFLHYEISNYGRPNHMAVHNTNYWKSVPYIGIGPSAHSYDGHRRRWNVADNQKYVKKISAEDVFWESEELAEKDLYNEYIMTGFRTMWGVDEAKIEEFSKPIQDEFHKAMKNVIDQGHIINKNGTYTLSAQGKAIADRIISVFFFL